jgi:hypothetical protein
MKLTPVPKRSGLDRLSFKKEFLDPMKPVVFTDLIDTWPAKEKWTFEFFIEKYGDVEVPCMTVVSQKEVKIIWQLQVR